MEQQYQHLAAPGTKKTQHDYKRPEKKTLPILAFLYFMYLFLMQKIIKNVYTNLDTLDGYCQHLHL